jgi:hypothetical protein
MVSEQQQVARFEHCAERLVTGVARCRFEARGAALNVYANADAFESEFGTNELTMALPGFGAGIQSMVDVKRNQAITRRCQRRGVQQDRRIQTTAETHDDPTAVCRQNRGNGFFDRLPGHAAERR